MAVALVQKKGGASGGAVASLNVTLDAPPTAGNLMVAVVNSDATIATPSGFTLAISAVSGQGLYIFYRVVVGGDSATVTFTPDHSTAVAAGIIEYSGLTATPLDKTASNTTGGGSSIATGTTATTSQADELLLAVIGPHNPTSGSTFSLTGITAGYTAQVSQSGLGANPFNAVGMFAADQIVSATGTQAATGTISPNFNDAGAAIATWKAVPGTVHPLAATGLASSSGSMALNVIVVLAAAGLASSSGSATLNVTITLSATGLASSTGSMALGIQRALSADGLAASTGSMSMNVLRALTATGLASSAGSMNVGLPVPVAAGGLAATTGSFAFSSGASSPFGPTKIALGASGWPTKAGI